eukprot:SAG31_NODE_2756_length_5139_cov_22.240675_2_plen_1292_part_00
MLMSEASAKGVAEEVQRLRGRFKQTAEASGFDKAVADAEQIIHAANTPKDPRVAEIVERQHQHAADVEAKMLAVQSKEAAHDAILVGTRSAAAGTRAAQWISQHPNSSYEDNPYREELEAVDTELLASLDRVIDDDSPLTLHTTFKVDGSSGKDEEQVWLSESEKSGEDEEQVWLSESEKSGEDEEQVWPSESGKSERKRSDKRHSATPRNSERKAGDRAKVAKTRPGLSTHDRAHNMDRSRVTIADGKKSSSHAHSEAAHHTKSARHSSGSRTRAEILADARKHTAEVDKKQQSIRHKVEKHNQLLASLTEKRWASQHPKEAAAKAKEKADAASPDAMEVAQEFVQSTVAEISGEKGGTEVNPMSMTTAQRTAARNALQYRIVQTIKQYDKARGKPEAAKLKAALIAMREKLTTLSPGWTPQKAVAIKQKQIKDKEQEIDSLQQYYDAHNLAPGAKLNSLNQELDDLRSKLQQAQAAASPERNQTTTTATVAQANSAGSSTWQATVPKSIFPQITSSQSAVSQITGPQVTAVQTMAPQTAAKAELLFASKYQRTETPKLHDTVLATLKPSELRQRARAAGVPESDLDAADDTANPRQTLTEMIMKTTSPTAEEIFRQSLSSLRSSDLHKAARVAGIDESILDSVDDDMSPRQALVDLVAHALTSETPVSASQTSAPLLTQPSTSTILAQQPTVPLAAPTSLAVQTATSYVGVPSTSTIVAQQPTEPLAAPTSLAAQTATSYVDMPSTSPIAAQQPTEPLAAPTSLAAQTATSYVDMQRPLEGIGLPEPFNSWSCTEYAAFYGVGGGSCAAEMIRRSPNCDEKCQEDPSPIVEACPITCGAAAQYATSSLSPASTADTVLSATEPQSVGQDNASVGEAGQTSPSLNNPEDTAVGFDTVLNMNISAGTNDSLDHDGYLYGTTKASDPIPAVSTAPAVDPLAGLSPKAKKIVKHQQQHAAAVEKKKEAIEAKVREHNDKIIAGQVRQWESQHPGQSPPAAITTLQKRTRTDAVLPSTKKVTGRSPETATKSPTKSQVDQNADRVATLKALEESLLAAERITLSSTQKSAVKIISDSNATAASEPQTSVQHPFASVLFANATSRTDADSNSGTQNTTTIDPTKMSITALALQLREAKRAEILGESPQIAVSALASSLQNAKRASADQAARLARLKQNFHKSAVQVLEESGTLLDPLELKEQKQKAEMDRLVQKFGFDGAHDKMREKQKRIHDAAVAAQTAMKAQQQAAKEATRIARLAPPPPPPYKKPGLAARKALIAKRAALRERNAVLKEQS